MRVFNFIITSLAVIVGLIGAALLMTVGFVAFVLLRLFGRPAVRPRFRPPTVKPAYSGRDDVIDI